MKPLHAGFAAALVVCLNTTPSAATAQELAPASPRVDAIDLHIACMALIPLRSLPAPLLRAMAGDGDAFPRVQEGVNGLRRTLPKPQPGADEAAPKASSAKAAGIFDPMQPAVERLERNASALVARQTTVVQARRALQAVSRQSVELLDAVQRLLTEQTVARARPYDIVVTSQLAMLSQRIGKSASEFLTDDGLNPDAVFLIGKDVQVFQALASAALNGDASLGLRPPRSRATRERAAQLMQQFELTHKLVDQVLAGLKDLVAAREAQSQMLADAETLDTALAALCAGPPSASAPVHR